MPAEPQDAVLGHRCVAVLVDEIEQELNVPGVIDARGRPRIQRAPPHMQPVAGPDRARPSNFLDASSSRIAARLRNASQFIRRGARRRASRRR